MSAYSVHVQDPQTLRETNKLLNVIQRQSWDWENILRIQAALHTKRRIRKTALPPSTVS